MSETSEDEVLIVKEKIPIILDGKFFKIIKEKNDSGPTTAQCKFCNSRIKGSKLSTSNFLSHLKHKHPTLVKTYENYKRDTYIPPSKKPKLNEESSKSVSTNDSSSVGSQNIFSFNKNKRAEQLISKFVLESSSSFKIVENPAFVNMITEISKMGSIKCPSRKQVSRSVDKIFDELQKNIMKDIKDHKYFCTTADIWSHARKSYLGVTLHFIDNKFKRKSSAIACERFKGKKKFIV